MFLQKIIAMAVEEEGLQLGIQSSFLPSEQLSRRPDKQTKTESKDDSQRTVDGRPFPRQTPLSSQDTFRKL